MTTTPSSLLLPPPAVILLVILAAAAEAQGQQPMARQGCRHKCGNMSIPFPFGMGKPGCFREGFQVVCNHSSHPPRAFLADNRTFADEGYMYRNNSQSYSRRVQSPLELVSISVATGEARVYAAVSYRCGTNHNESFSRYQAMDFSDSPFAMSATRNVLVGVGSEAEAALYWSVVENANAVASFTCRAQDDQMDGPHARNGSCTGVGLLRAHPPGRHGLRQEFRIVDKPRGPQLVAGNQSVLPRHGGGEVMVQLLNAGQVRRQDATQKVPPGRPPRARFRSRERFVSGGRTAAASGLACISGNSSCANATYTYTPSYICKCWEGYDGNPYVTQGCQDIDECKLPEVYPCSNGGICKNRPGGYDCPCKFGMKGDGKAGTCTDAFTTATAKATVGKYSTAFLFEYFLC